MGEQKKILIIRGGLFGLSVAFFALITYLVASGRLEEVDNLVSQAFYQLRTPGLTTLMEGLTYLGNWESITVICLLLLIYPKTRFAYGIPVSSVSIITTLIKAGVKPLLARARPEAIYHLIDQRGYSYPSGHAITSIAVFMILIIMVRKNVEDRKKANWISLALLIPALGIGLSRIYLGVHHPSDVMGAWFAGLAATAAVCMIMEKIKIRD